MQNLESAKNLVTKLYKENQTVHMDVSLPKMRINLKDDEVKIVGVYPHIFQIEQTKENGKKYILQYSDILTKSIIIHEA